MDIGIFQASTGCNVDEKTAKVANCAASIYNTVMTKIDYIAVAICLSFLGAVGTIVLVSLHNKYSGPDMYHCIEAGGIPISGNAWLWDKNRRQNPVCLNPSALIELTDG